MTSISEMAEPWLTLNNASD